MSRAAYSPNRTVSIYVSSPIRTLDSSNVLEHRSRGSPEHDRSSKSPTLESRPLSKPDENPRRVVETPVKGLRMAEIGALAAALAVDVPNLARAVHGRGEQQVAVLRKETNRLHACATRDEREEKKRRKRKKKNRAPHCAPLEWPVKRCTHFFGMKPAAIRVSFSCRLRCVSSAIPTFESSNALVDGRAEALPNTTVRMCTTHRGYSKGRVSTILKNPTDLQRTNGLATDPSRRGEGAVVVVVESRGGALRRAHPGTTLVVVLLLAVEDRLRFHRDLKN